MGNSSSSFMVFWRKRLPKRYRYFYYILAFIAIILLLVIPAFASYSYLNNLNKDNELIELLEVDNNTRNTTMLVKMELEEYSRLQAALESTDPNSPEYETARASCDSLRQEIADTIPSLIKGYDKDSLPVLMSYQEYLKKTAR